MSWDELGLGASPYRYEDVVASRRFHRSSECQFDRLAFALRAVELLGAKETVVVVYRSTTLKLRQGPDLRRGVGARWAMVGVPPDASAESIALALTELEGVHAGPFLFELALAAAQNPAPGA